MGSCGHSLPSAWRLPHVVCTPQWQLARRPTQCLCQSSAGCSSPSSLPLPSPQQGFHPAFSPHESRVPLNQRWHCPEMLPFPSSSALLTFIGMFTSLWKAIPAPASNAPCIFPSSCSLMQPWVIVGPVQPHCGSTGGTAQGGGQLRIFVSGGAINTSVGGDGVDESEAESRLGRNKGAKSSTPPCSGAKQGLRLCLSSTFCNH